MKRPPWGLAVLAAAFVAASEAGASSLDPGTLSEARDIQLERWEWAEPGEPVHTIASARAKPDWLSRLARIVLRDSARVPDSVCVVACGRCPDQVRVSVGFSLSPARHYSISAPPPRRSNLTLFLRESLAIVYSDSAWFSAFRFADAAEEVARLLREVPGRKAFLDPGWRPPAAEPAPLPPDSAAFRGDNVFTTGVPEAVNKVWPKYPGAAVGFGVGGVVDVYVLVTAEGTVARVHAAERLRHAEGPAALLGGVLREAAESAVRDWTFKPATCGDRPIAVWVRVPVHFRLE